MTMRFLVQAGAPLRAKGHVIKNYKRKGGILLPKWGLFLSNWDIRLPRE